MILFPQREEKERKREIINIFPNRVGLRVGPIEVSPPNPRLSAGNVAVSPRRQADAIEMEGKKEKKLWLAVHPLLFHVPHLAINEKCMRPFSLLPLFGTHPMAIPPPKPTPPSLSLNPPSVLRCVCLSGPGDAPSPRASTPIWGPTPIVKTSLPPTHYPISNSISPCLPFLPPTSFSISSSGFNVFSFLRSELMHSTSTWVAIQMQRRIGKQDKLDSIRSEYFYKNASLIPSSTWRIRKRRRWWRWIRRKW